MAGRGPTISDTPVNRDTSMSEDEDIVNPDLDFGCMDSPPEVREPRLTDAVPVSQRTYFTR